MANTIIDPARLARALGGEVGADGQVRAPGPGHSPRDRSLSVKVDLCAPDGFVVKSFADDDPIECRDYVRKKAGLPAYNGNGYAKRGRLTEDQIAEALQRVVLSETRSRISKIYDYTDEAGAVLYQVLRYEPKDFRQRRPDGAGWIWKLGDVTRVLYRLPELQAFPSATLFVCEGEKDADRVASLGHCATTVAAGEWSKVNVTALAGRDLFILEDNDAPGRKKALAAARRLHGTARTIRIVRLPDAKDISEWLDCDPCRASGLTDICLDAPLWDPEAADIKEAPTAKLETAEFVVPTEKAQHCEPVTEKVPHPDLANFRKMTDQKEPQWQTWKPKSTGEREWPEPKPLPNGLLPVLPFDLALLPATIAPWVADVAERMQCPPDFVGVPAVVALGSVLGRRVGVRPQRRTDWLEVPNLWGCIVGRPGMMKSPAMAEALKPLHRLEAEARKSNDEAHKAYAVSLEAHKLKKEAARKKAKTSLGSGADPVEALSLDQPEAPKDRRYIANDCTYEALGEILANNPNGVLAFRDELVSLLKTLDREEYAAARGFFLSAWNGTGGYTFDRIIRGHTHIEAACVSLLGSTQPGRLAEYVRRAVSGGAADDGLIQRFGLLVWPDGSPEWTNVDRYPDRVARQAAWSTFERLDKLTADEIGADRDQFEVIPFLRLDDEAHEIFDDWRMKLEGRLRSTDLHPALESHLAKYRKLVPSLALICALADGGTRRIDGAAVLRALAFAEYLESHARRCYAAGSEAEIATAKAILSRIGKGGLSDGFTCRDVHRQGWSNLSGPDQVQSGLNLLVDCDWLAAEPIGAGSAGGRPKIVYRINPRASR